MPNRKKQKKNESKLAETKDLSQQIVEALAGLTYMSETDAEITPFVGQQTEYVTVENLLLQTGKTKDMKVEVKEFDEFFSRLIKIQDWFSEDERKMTEKFIKLKKILQQNLINKKVFRLGKKEIDIFVVGLDKDNILRGIQTRAVET
jgi:C4-type Zn-finger protein